MQSMHVVHLCSELTPVAKVGGLGDVVHGLAKETMARGHLVDVILPKYDCLDYEKLQGLQVEQRELWSYEGPDKYNNTIWKAECDGLNLLLLEPHHPSYYFSRNKIYGCPDDIDRFLYFCRAALEYLFKSGRKPDVIHLHDWPVAAAAVLYKEMYVDLGLKAKGVVLTIHNLQHQGKCAPKQLARMGLDEEVFIEKLQDPYNEDLINLLKGGIEYSDQIVTVSPNYEKEIQTVEGGCGLHTVLQNSSVKLHGILNGIDATYWNPESDPHLIARYSSKGKLDGLFQAKKENKKQLFAHLNLKGGQGPLVAAVTRLVPQKGPELLHEGILRTLEHGGEFVLLGSAASPEIEKSFLKLQKELANNRHVSIILDRDEALAHLIFAAADLFLIPSIFEPCGLTQLIALRYGTVPIARMTGGLVDTVADIDTSQRPLEQRNGFTFDFPDSKGVQWALKRAIDCYRKDRVKWAQIVRNGVAMDFSWTHPTEEYLKIYLSLCH